MCTKEQKSEYNKRYYQSHKSQMMASNKAWKKKNPENIRVSAKKYRDSHKDSIRESGIKYAAEHKEAHLKRVHDYRKRHPDRVSAYFSEYQKNNIELFRTYAHSRRARVKGCGGRYSVKEWRDLVEKYDSTCMRCGKRTKMSADHIVPISHGGRNDIWNLQALCLSCNHIKNDRTQDYILLRTIDEAKSMQRHGHTNDVPTSYLDAPWINLFENARYEQE